MAKDKKQKLKGASRTKQKEAVKSAKKNDTRFGSNKGYKGFHKVEEGKNIFRMMPPHNPEHPAYEPMRSTMLDCMVEKRDDEGKGTGEKELKRKRLFIATQHLEGAKADPIELYIKYIYAYADEAYSDKSEKDKFLKHVTGYRGADKKWVWGIKPQNAFVGYAIKDGELQRIELRDKWVDELDKEAVKLEADGEVMEIDPFSDPEEGYPVCIMMSKNDKGKWEFDISAVTMGKKDKTWGDFFKKHAITDKQANELLEQTPLAELYQNTYKRRDFDFAIDGLKRFDKEHGYGMFKNEDFLTDLEEFEACLPEEEAEENKKDKKKDKKGKKKKEEAPEETSEEKTEKSEKKDKKKKKKKNKEE